MKFCVIIPVYNEGKNIRSLIKRTLKFAEEIIIVDDGSDEKTKKCLKKIPQTVITHKKNLGKGSALKTGFKYALKEDFDFVITMDGDGQHDPKEITRFIEEYKTSDSDIIIGSRMYDFKNFKNMPKIRTWTNRATSILLSWFCKKRLKDTQSGYRLISSKVLRALNLKTKRFDLECEILIKANRMNFKISEININTIYGRTLSKINPFMDTLRFFRVVVKSLSW